MDVISWLRDAETAMPLDQLAERTGYSPSHLQKIFKTSIGLSPAAYARALRVERARAELRNGKSVSDAIYAAGFESPSRFYENMDGRLGMTPSIWRKGGEGMTIRWVEAPTTLGPVLIAASEKGVCRVAFNTPPEDLTRLFPKATIVEGDADFADLFQRVVAAVENPGRSHDIPLDVQGTVFQERIWAELCKIPPGETRSYGQLAAASDKPGASRAAGSANGANRIAVLIPCHRVIRADGSIGGYAFGEEIKRELLRRENSAQDDG
ncbi:methylated-DNA--[protein]-cysteine S-methyltransferase [Altericroceibacterium endophyticum]